VILSTAAISPCDAQAPRQAPDAPVTLRPGGLLIVDDVNRYMPSLTMSPTSLLPPTVPAAAAFGGWRRIGTSKSLQNTAIFVKASEAGRRRVR
jgi:hypothetical protein